MDEVWQLPPKKRIQRWRELRKRICEYSDLLEQLQVVLEFWRTTPIGTSTIDPFDESTWSTPWELLHQNDYDENVISLGMAYTLHYSNISCRLLLVQNVEKSNIKLIVLVDNKYILNYNYNNIDTTDIIEKELEVLKNIDVSALSK
tara:strand:+ start:4078 stop:4515 length:438 start_codon:yes stop_codon:yes gene_type:complete